MIAVLEQREITAVSLYKTHAPWADGTPNSRKAVAQKFSDAGIAVTSTGMIELPNDESVVRKALENVRAAGLKTFCGWLKQTDSLPLVDKLVKEYDLKVAIHNHGPTEALATGMDVWKAVQPFDQRIGLCLDVGHGFRAGENAADTIRQCNARIYEVHLRDTAVTGGAMKDPQPVIIGLRSARFPLHPCRAGGGEISVRGRVRIREKGRGPGARIGGIGRRAIVAPACRGARLNIPMTS